MIYVAAILPVLVGVGLLAVDGARLYNLQTLLQKGADALALTGAKELDGRATAITRANNAINVLLQNQHKFSGGGVGAVTVALADRLYLTGLPASDATVIDATSPLVTADPTQAQFVQVTVTPVTLNTIFPIAFLGGGGAATPTSATAVAGFNLVACQFTPVYICNPFEGTGTSILDVVNNPDLKRRLINLKKQGGTGAQNSPGNYGLLQPLANPGADALRDMIGMSNPPACFLQNGVNLRPGFVATVREAVNVRFDLYNGPMNSNRNNPDFRPARSVRKGYTGPACNPSPDEGDPGAVPPVPPESLKMLRDNCFTTVPTSCMHMPDNVGGDPDSRMGNGEWDFNLYWSTNFPGVPIPSNGNGVYDCGGSGQPCPNPPSRYDIYRHEIDAGLTGTPSQGGLPPSGEVGNPQCSASATSDDPDRRMLFGAVINCQEVGLDGGSSGPYPVEAFVEFFLTEPIETGPDEDIYVEIVDVFEPGGAGGGAMIRSDVQLYR